MSENIKERLAEEVRKRTHTYDRKFMLEFHHKDFGQGTCFFFEKEQMIPFVKEYQVEVDGVWYVKPYSVGIPEIGYC